MNFIKFLFFSFINIILSTSSFGQQSLPPDWHKNYKDTLQGSKSEAALSFLKKNKIKAKKAIIVGVIDSGVDTTALDLLPAFWTNQKEKLDGKDNDRNGYIDDVHGWNFLGDKTNTFNMVSAGTEEYREFKRLFPKYKNHNPINVKDDEEFAYFQKVKKKTGIVNYIKFAEYTAIKGQAYASIDSVLNIVPKVNKDTLTVAGVMRMPIADSIWNGALQAILPDIYQAKASILWNKLVENHQTQLDLMRKRIEGIEKDPDKRLLIGDDLQNPEDLFYGNSNLQIEGCEHGTFIAGVIAAQGVYNLGLQGIYPDAKLMIIRAIPDGDEYDKDVATAIRYAVDNGAQVINMSFGKYTSPSSDMVNRAIAYACRKDVLLVQAAGNDNLNIDSIAYFPSAKDNYGDMFPNYLRVGASDKMGKRCTFSNYGAKEVTIFAPGEHITSLTLKNKLLESQGTSVATPVVASVAAMIRAYFPKLKAAQVKEILIKSVRPMVEKDLSISGGIIDALAAVKLAKSY